MTKIKFYAIKITIFIFCYFFIYILYKDDFYLINKISSTWPLWAKTLLGLFMGIIFIVSNNFVYNYKRPKLPEEVEEEKRKEKEDNKRYELEQKELFEKAKQRNRELLPVVEITLFTNEKIKGQFLEKSEYLEDLETSTKYYKAYIVKIEKI